MRKVILQLAVSLDSLIEGPNGEYDWCFTDGDYGMTEFVDRIDAIFMGRKTYELVLSIGESATPGSPAVKEYVFSNTLTNVEGDRVLVSGDVVSEVRKLKNQPGKDIWLYGGASLTSLFINEGLVDEMALAVHPVLLGAGKPLFTNILKRNMLRLIGTTSYPSGLVMLSYSFR